MALVCNRDKRGGGQSRTSWFMNEGDVSMFTLSDERQGSKQRKIISLYLLDLWSELGRVAQQRGQILFTSQDQDLDPSNTTLNTQNTRVQRREHLYLVRNTFRLSESLTNSSYQPCHM